MNPYLDLVGNKLTFIKDILHEAQIRESMPDRMEPLTKEMTEYIINKEKKLSKANQDNIYSAIRDWFVLGEQAGFRRKECTQERTYLKNIKIINAM